MLRIWAITLCAYNVYLANHEDTSTLKTVQSDDGK